MADFSNRQIDSYRIVQVSGGGDSIISFATEPAAADSLDVRLRDIAERNQVVGLRDALLVAALVADAVDYAHHHKLVHGRLEPGKILLERLAPLDDPAELPLRVLVTGFGPGSAPLPSRTQDQAQGRLNGQTDGLPYLAPEQFLSEEMNARSDIYALGAILYQLVTGRLPYTLTSTAEAVRVHSARERLPAPQEIRPGLPATVAAIIYKAMARPPEKRFQTARQMAYALRQAAALLTETAERNFAPPEMAASLLAPPVPARVTGDGRPATRDGRRTDNGWPAAPKPSEPISSRVARISYFRNLGRRIRPHQFFAAGLLVIWLLVLAGVPAYLPVQLASWLAFTALLITPGYLLADLITWRVPFDRLERLAIALPLGVAILTVPGAIALLWHVTLTMLVSGWTLFTALIAAAWLWHGLRTRWRDRPPDDANQRVLAPWAVDEILMLLLLLAAFIAVMPTLSLHKIDGDAYAVAAFAADALSGLPLNASEPLFGTDFGPGVRMVFNQSLPLSFLWSYLSKIDPITLTAAASRSMLAFWALLATYTLGKAAGSGSRRFGLFAASIQMLIYLAAPFARGDNVSLFFFERINADKFMVPATMLPVVFALAIRFVSDHVAHGSRDAGVATVAHSRRGLWLAAAVAAFAVSTIHPLVAAMLALGLGAFAGLHWLLNLRQWSALRRTLALGGLVAVAMFLPAVQLLTARGQAPLAASYPDTLEGWPIGEKLTPVLPFTHVRTLDLHGPLPVLSQLEASAANRSTNPFLVWRFAVNMDRQRLILFDLDQYISDPTLILEPPYLLALLLLPVLLWGIRRHIAAQFAVATTVAVLFIMFNPVVTPLIGSLVMPWILWRFVWVLPYALVIALAAYRLLLLASPALVTWVRRLPVIGRPLAGGSQSEPGAPLMLGFVVIASLALTLPIVANMQNLNDRSAAPYFFPTPERMLIRLNELTGRSGPVTVLADQDLSVTIPAYVARANVVAHRAPTTSEIFPADHQDEALQRLIDQDTFFAAPYLTTAAIDILRRYDAGYVITTSGSDLDMQLRLAPQWFEWLMDDQSYSLHRVRHLPAVTAAIRGNDALAQQRWAAAERFYQAALAEDPGDPATGSGQALLALVGLAESAYAQGRFDDALNRLKQAQDAAVVGVVREPPHLAILHYRLGRLYAERGQVELAVAEFRQAQQAAPHVSRFHVALGHACLADGDDECATAQYVAAVASEGLPDEASQLIAQADLWRQQGRLDRALPLYQQAVALRPSQYNRLVLERVYREVGQFARAQSLVRALRVEHPLSAEMAIASAVASASQGQIDEAFGLYRRAIWVQTLQAQATATTRLALARLLLETGHLAQAAGEIERVLLLQPYDATAHRLQGDLYSRQQRFDQATAAYRRAFELDPSQITFYASSGEQLGQYDGPPDERLAQFQAAIQANPEEAALWLALGDEWQRLGDSQSALDAYHVALSRLDSYLVPTRLRPLASRQSRAFVCARLARVYENLGQVEAAMNYYQAMGAAAPGDPWAQVTLGDALRRRNDLAAAEAAYRQAIGDGDIGDGPISDIPIAHQPGYLNAYIRLAELLAALGDQAQADELYTRALEIAGALREAPLRPLEQQAELPATAAFSLPFSLPIFSDETMDGSAPPADGEASTTFWQQWRQAGGNVNAVGGLARLYLTQGQARQAIELYEQRLTQGEVEGWSPAVMAQYYKSLGDLYLSQNQLDQATAAYQQAVTLAGGWTEARLSLAEALAGQGNGAAALAQLQTAAAAAPGSVEAQVALANLLDQQGRPHRALAIYQAVAAAYPGHARATLALARAWQDRLQWDQAEQLYQQTVALNPGTADAYADLAELYINQGRYDEAEALLRQALAVDQQNANIYVRLGDLAQSRGNSEQALAWYRQAAAPPLIGQSSNVTLVDSLIRHGDFATALATIENALDHRSSDGELWLRRGEIQRLMGRYTEAEEALREAIHLNPADGRPHVALGALYLAQGDSEAALVAYQRAIDLQPVEAFHYLAASQVLITQADFDSALAVLQAGQSQADQPAPLVAAMAALYLQQAQPDLALQILEDGLAKDSENVQLRLALANYYAARADYDQAEQQLNLVLAQQPDSAAAHATLGDLYHRRGDSARAMNHYEQAVVLEPANPGHLLALGNSYQLGQRTEEATSAYVQALAALPILDNAYAMLAAHYQGLERWDEAQVVYERGLALAPTSEILLGGYSAFLLGRGQAEEALTLLDEAVQRSPTAATLTARASLYRSLERNEEAEQDLQAAQEQAPGSIAVLVALGDFYRALGDTERARYFYENAVSLLPGVPTGYLRLGDLASELGNQEEAQQYAEAAWAAEPGALVRPESAPQD